MCSIYVHYTRVFPRTTSSSPELQSHRPERQERQPANGVQPIARTRGASLGRGWMLGTLRAAAAGVVPAGKVVGPGPGDDQPVLLVLAV
jgi:hypothetical protein